MRRQESCGPMSGGGGAGNAGGAAQQMHSAQSTMGTIQRPAHAKEYHFLDIELKYGILQVSFPSFVSCPCHFNGITFHSIPSGWQKASCVAHRDFRLRTIVYCILFNTYISINRRECAHRMRKSSRKQSSKQNDAKHFDFKIYC